MSNFKRRVVEVLPLMAVVLCLVAGMAEAASETDGEVEVSDKASMVRAGKGPALLNAPGLSKGVDAIIEKIRTREVDLAVREQMLAERERTVVELEAVIDQRAMELDRIRKEVEERITTWSAQGQDRVSQLAGVYSSMPAQKAGALLGKLDLDLSVSIIRGMKKKNSAGALAAMRPDRALLVSQRMLRPLDPRADAPASPKK